MRRRGKVFIVGAGPGDSGLITLRGARLIQQADVIVMDALVNPWIVAGARGKIVDAGKRGRSSETEPRHGPSQSSINRRLVRLARQGKIVVRLKGGDPFLFGRGSEELEALKSARIPFEVVPGVSSAIAGPAYAGIPVTDRRWASQVTFVTGHERTDKRASAVDWKRISPEGTLVCLMGVRPWPALRDRLIAEGWRGSTPVAAIQSATTSRQRVIRSSLRDSATVFRKSGLAAPAVIVVGRVAALSSRLDWIRRERPLLGRRVVVTRAAEGNERLAALLEAEGAEVLSCPLISVRPVRSSELPRLRSSASDRDFDWLIFLSANGVRMFSAQWPEAARLLKGVAVAAVGPQTAEAARSAGWSVRKVPSEFTSAALSRALGRLRGKRLLVPRAKTAPEELVRSMRRKGADVRVVPVYETISLKPAAAVRRAVTSQAEAITFLSASAAEAFGKSFAPGLRRQIFRSAFAVSIGPMTSAALRRIGARRIAQARRSTAEGVIDELRRYFSSK